MLFPFFFFFLVFHDGTSFSQVGTGHTVATLADASELPGVTVAQVNYSTVTDGEVTPTSTKHVPLNHILYYNVNTHSDHLILTEALSNE